MPLQILIAENDANFLATTTEFLEDKFETISAKNPDEAKLVVQNNPLLAALVIDRRLRDDRDSTDQSGWDVALEARENGPARAPIIMYSTFEPTSKSVLEPPGQPAMGHLPRISDLSKGAGLEALKGKILEEIHLNLREASDLRDIPRYHQPPIITFAPHNGVKDLTEILKKAGETAEISADLAELKTAATIYPSAMFVVDVVDDVGIDAIRLLHQSQDISSQNFYIVARTSADEFRNRATQAGVNAFVTKHSPQMDALEVIMRMSEYKIEIEKATAAKPQTQLALLQYGELLTQLREARRSSEYNISAALDIVRKALNWPLLVPEEKLVLTSLYLRMLAASETGLNTEELDICIDGASMLAKDRAATGNVQEWIERARNHSSDFSLGWADEDSLLGDDESNG